MPGVSRRGVGDGTRTKKQSLVWGCSPRSPPRRVPRRCGARPRGRAPRRRWREPAAIAAKEGLERCARGRRTRCPAAISRTRISSASESCRASPRVDRRARSENFAALSSKLSSTRRKRFGSASTVGTSTSTRQTGCARKPLFEAGASCLQHLTALQDLAPQGGRLSAATTARSSCAVVITFASSVSAPPIFLDVFEMLLARVVCPVRHQLERQANAGRSCALVRDLAKAPSPSAASSRFDPPSHRGATEIADFIAARDTRAGRQVPSAKVSSQRGEALAGAVTDRARGI